MPWDWVEHISSKSYWSNNVHLYLCNDEAAGHAQTGFGSKMAGDHDTEARFWKPELWRAVVHDLVHHDHRPTAVFLGGLDWGVDEDDLNIEK